MSRQGNAELRGWGAIAALGCRTRNLLSPPQPGGWRAWGGGSGLGAGGRAVWRRHQAARLKPCVRRRHAHTCPPPLPDASLAARAERARLNFPFILGPGGRARWWRSFSCGLSGTRAGSRERVLPLSYPKARSGAGCGRARLSPPLAVFVAAVSVGACHFGPAARSAGS